MLFRSKLVREELPAFTLYDNLDGDGTSGRSDQGPVKAMAGISTSGSGGSGGRASHGLKVSDESASNGGGRGGSEYLARSDANILAIAE